MNMTQYDQNFFAGHTKTALPSSNEIVPFLLDIFSSKSVVDFGCGTGFWLKAFKDFGVESVKGLDGDYVDREMLQIDIDEFVAIDLSKPINLNDNYDLAISLEVAEHLPEERADGFVANLCQVAPIIVFSAAIPGQGGNGHINEQWPAYWVKKFEENNFLCFDIIRNNFWNNSQVSWWYKQNIFIFILESHIKKIDGLNNVKPIKSDAIINFVHPDLFSKKLTYENPGFGKWIKMFRKAVLKSFKKRF